MPVSMDALVDDVAAETAVLREILAGLSQDDWRRDTPAAGWTIADQVSHLAHFDATAVRSAVDPDAFRSEVRGAPPIDPDAVAARYRDMSGAELLSWFDEGRTRLLEAFGPLDPGLRVPWYGPAMSAASALTARLMET